MPGSLLRTFICIDIPKGHKEKISKWIAAVRGGVPQVRWVDAETLHVTLKFCGEMPSETVDTLSEKLAAISKIGAIELSLGGIGGFPALSSPRVVWCGIHGDINKLRTIQKDTEKIALYAGIPKENRPYSPHITLGRRNAPGEIPKAAEEILMNTPLELEPWKADKIILMKSELRRFGPIYTPLALFKITQTDII